MSPERWKLVTDLFDAAAAHSAEERGRYLAQACGGDTALRAEVERLLADDSRSADFLRAATRPALSSRDSDSDPFSDVATQARVGAYRLVRRIGDGGMGTVWLAERADDQFHGRVAVKLLQRGMDTRDVLERFRLERQVLANLRHPHISRLLDGGATPEGRPFLIMEYVDGLPIDRYCDEQRLSVNRRLELLRTICSAVQFAHQNLVVHRDLKPGNILVNSAGTATLLDFGIAKVLRPAAGAPEVTSASQRMMTPEFASPEQFRGEPITTASDVYSLGVILYELLTGSRPHRVGEGTLGQFERRVCEEEPLAPSVAIATEREAAPDRRGEADGGNRRAEIADVARRRGLEPAGLQRRLRGDLDNIVLKALRKEPQRRYASVEQFSEDIRLHLAGLPVSARPDTFRYRCGKFVRRNRLAVALASTVFALLAAMTFVTRVQSARIEAQRRLADQRYQQTRQVAEFQSDMLGEIDAPTMGYAVIMELRRQIEANLPYRRVADGSGGLRPLNSEESNDVLRRFDESVALGNPTDVARHVLDQSVLTPAITALAQRFGDQPEIEADLRYSIGAIYQRLGLFEAGREQLGLALELRRRLLGNQNTHVADALTKLGLLLHDHGNFADAEPVMREALAIRRALPDSDNPSTAECLNNLGILMLSLQRPAEAEQLLRETLEMRRRIPETTDAAMAQGLHNLSQAIWKLKGPAAAEPLLREALAVHRKDSTLNYVNIANSLNSLAGLLLEQGKFADAEPFMREALDLRERRLGKEHPSTIATVNNLAGVLLKQNRFAEAEPLARQALAGRIMTMPADNPYIAISRIVLADALTGMGQEREAQAQLEQALAALQSNSSAPPEFIDKTLERLVKVCRTLRQQKRAAAYEAMRRPPPSGAAASASHPASRPS